ITIANGNYLSQVLNISRSTFVLRNKKDEEFRLFLEHESELGAGAELEVKIDRPPTDWSREAIPGGWRIALTLGPKEDLSLKLTETRKTDQQVVLDERNFIYLLNGSAALVATPQIRAALNIQEQIRDYEER